MNITKLAYTVSLLLVGLGLAVNGYSQSFLTNGLVAYYPFNGNANDASGNGNSGTVDGATLTTDRFGIPNSAYYFNGGSSDIIIPETLFGPTNQAWTISVWITTDNGPYSAQQEAFNKSSVNGEMDMGIVTGQIFFAVHTASQSWVSTFAPLLTNSTIHVVGVYKRGQNISLYINGVLQDSVPVSNENLWVSAFPLNSSLGSYHYAGGPYEWFRGKLDDFRVYTRALSTSEVQQLYAYESNTCPAPIITSQPRGQVGYWGKSVTLSVTAVGVPPLSYQWLKGGTPIDGGSGSSLVLTNLQLNDAGNYSVVVTNECGNTTSSNAFLTMNPAGVSLALYSGITIDGVVGLTYGIQCSIDLSDTNGWRGMANVTLGTPSELWFDVQPANQVRRYYRVVPGPIPVL
jgi:hypothetical protein